MPRPWSRTLITTPSTESAASVERAELISMGGSPYAIALLTRLLSTCHRWPRSTSAQASGSTDVTICAVAGAESTTVSTTSPTGTEWPGARVTAPGVEPEAAAACR